MSVNKTETIRRSIEVEYWVIDEEGYLAEPGGIVDSSDGVEREFVEPLVEVKTSPCETTEELRDELFERLEGVVSRADELGKSLVPLGTPVNCGRICELPSERNRIQNVVVGDSFECARHCAGTHIHVEQQPGHEVDQLNTLIALDPALALVNSSPYFRGERTVAGARSKLYRREAYEEVPHQGQLWRYIETKDEWRRRLERRHEEFTVAALKAGVDRRTVEANFCPDSCVWTPVQLREEFGTVEWRSPDTALPSEVLRLADEIAEIAETACEADVRIDGKTGRVSDDDVVLPEFDSVLVYLDDAIQEGLASEDLRSYLRRMGLGVDDYEPVSQNVGGRKHVSKKEARRIRLEHSDRLEGDLRRTSRVAGD